MSKLKTDIQRTRDRQLAEWMRLGLAKSGVEKQAIAQELGLHPSAISHMLRGARGALEEHTLHRVTRLADGKHYVTPLEHAGFEAALEPNQALRGLVVGFYAPEPVDI